MSFFKSNPIAAPSDLELDLVEALETVTECAERAGLCEEATEESQKVLERARRELGVKPAAETANLGPDRTHG